MKQKVNLLKFLVVWMVGFNLITGGSAKAQCVNPPQGMVAWWPLDKLNGGGKYDDLRGIVNNEGTPIPGPGGVNPVPYPDEYVDNSLHFGINSYVKVQNHPELNFGMSPFTIDAWVKLTPAIQGPIVPIVYKLDQTQTLGYFLYIEKSGPATLKLKLQIGTVIYTGPIITDPSEWFFVAAVRTGTTVTLYYNTTNIMNTGGGPPPNATSDSVLLIGHSPFSFLTNDTWAIDEVEIFDRKLLANELANIFNADTAGKCKKQCIPPPLDMISWWPGDWNANDIISGNNGMVESGATFAQGKVDGAFLFNGQDGGGGINLGDVPAFNFTQSSSFTIDAWIYSFGPTVYPNESQIIVRLNYNCTGTDQSLGLDAASGDKVFFHIRDGGVPPVSTTLLSLNLLTKNEWHHVAGVRQVTNSVATLKLYVDGLLVTTATDISIGPLSLITPDMIGRRNGCPTTSSTNTFNGLIDEVEIFSRALRDTEIDSIFQAGSLGKCKRKRKFTPCPTCPHRSGKATEPSYETSLPDGSISFALEQNYPNPINTETNISYSLPEAVHVRIVVFDILGREVKVLVDREVAAGHYTTTWDATNTKGTSVPSGVYFYSLTAGSFRSTKKMVLMR